MSLNQELMTVLGSSWCKKREDEVFLISERSTTSFSDADSPSSSELMRALCALGCVRELRP